MISKKLAAEVINVASSTGADFVEIFAENSFNTYLEVENGKVEETRNSNISGVGLRILKGTRSVYGSTGDLSRKSLLELAKELSASFNGAREIEEVKSFKEKKFKNVNKPFTPLASVPIEDKVALLKKVNAVLSSHDPRIVKSTTAMIIRTNENEIFNSKGLLVKNFREYGRFIIESVASENGKIETRFDGPASQGGWEHFTKTLDLQALAKENAEKVIPIRKIPSNYW